MGFPGCNKFHYIYTMYTYNLGLFADGGVIYKQAYLVKMVFTQMRTFLFSKL